MKRFAFKAAGLFLIVAALGAGFFFVLKDSSLFDVRHVRVIGLTGSRAQRVRNAALGQSTLSFNEDEVRAAASGHPPVQSVSVETHPPHDVTVTVALYRAVAAVGVTAGALQAVSADGTVLPGLTVKGLPVVDGSVVGGFVRDRVVLESLKILQSAPPELRGRIASFARDPKFGLFAVLTAGPKIYFGDQTFVAAKWASAARVLSDPASRGAAYVDVRVPRRPAVGGVQGGVQGGIDPADPNQPVAPDGQASSGPVPQ